MSSSILTFPLNMTLRKKEQFDQIEEDYTSSEDIDTIPQTIKDSFEKRKNDDN
jgi:hypothetical protein